VVNAVAGALAGSWLLAAAARLSVPMWPVPMTGQTLAVLAFAGLLGPWVGVAAVALYLLQGALGAPFFSGGASGARVLLGPSGGYLAGFLLAAGVVGVAGLRARGPLALLGVMALGHLLVLAPGVLWLAGIVGLEAAVQRGGVALLPGAALKSVLAAALVLGGRLVLGRSTGRPDQTS
jgi:biotin transport system substrate-specific component